jgi:AraC-like DNA-binding protein
MSEASEPGVLYTDHSGLGATPLIASLWSYQTCVRARDRRSVTRKADGTCEYWLNGSDPLLNTILPGTGLSLIINLGDAWAAGRSLVTAEILPRVCVVGPVTQPRILRVGRVVQAMGVGLLPTMAPAVFNVPAATLVDRIVPLEDLWTSDDVERLLVSLSALDIPRCVARLKDVLIARIVRPNAPTVGETTVRLITLHAGRVSIDDIARTHGLSRQLFARRFRDTAGLSPKLFARITRFQALVSVLLSTDVSRWAEEATAVGFYDQAHMINEFRAFAGSPPTVFFRPHGRDVDDVDVQLRGRPSEWLRQP